MTQYDEVVEHQRLLIEAEEWSWGFKSLHIHAIQSCWYETEETKKHEKNTRKNANKLLKTALHR